MAAGSAGLCRVSNSEGKVGQMNPLARGQAKNIIISIRKLYKWPFLESCISRDILKNAQVWAPSHLYNIIQCEVKAKNHCGNWYLELPKKIWTLCEQVILALWQRDILFAYRKPILAVEHYILSVMFSIFPSITFEGLVIFFKA